MKKIFTLIISLGLVGFAFAQTGYRHQDDQVNQNVYEQRQHQPDNQYSRDNQHTMYSNGRTDEYNKQSLWSYDNEQYGFYRNGENRDRDEMIRREHFHTRYEEQRRNDDNYYQHRKFPVLRLLFGIRL